MWFWKLFALYESPLIDPRFDSDASFDFCKVEENVAILGYKGVDSG